MSHHIARMCHIARKYYVPQMSHQPFRWKMLVTTFQFTVRYKWSERKAPVPCTCFKIHYSSVCRSKKNDTNEVSVHVGVRVQYIYFPPLPSPSLFNYNMTRQPCCQYFYQFQFNFKFICKVLNYSSPFKLIL